MTEFDRQMYVRRIIGLYRERGLERIEHDIMSDAKIIVKRANCGLEDALEHIEQRLLSIPPPGTK